MNLPRIFLLTSRFFADLGKSTLEKVFLKTVSLKIPSLFRI